MFRTSESDLGQAVPSGAFGPNIGPSTVNNGNANLGSDFLIFYNQIKSVPGFIIEPYYILYSNRYNSSDNRGLGLGTPKHSDQTCHNVGSRIEMRNGNFDVIDETLYQFGQMGDIGGPDGLGYRNDDHIEVWATSLNLANTKDNWYRTTQSV